MTNTCASTDKLCRQKLFWHRMWGAYLGFPGKFSSSCNSPPSPLQLSWKSARALHPLSLRCIVPCNQLSWGLVQVCLGMQAGRQAGVFLTAQHHWVRYHPVCHKQCICTLHARRAGGKGSIEKTIRRSQSLRDVLLLHGGGGHVHGGAGINSAQIRLHGGLALIRCFERYSGLRLAYNFITTVSKVHPKAML
jgi:hypothetical protein